MISTVLRVFPQVHKLVSVVCTLLILESKWNSGDWRVNNTMETTILCVFPHNTFFVCFFS